jgi:hypothetical protein
MAFLIVGFHPSKGPTDSIFLKSVFCALYLGIRDGKLQMALVEKAEVCIIHAFEQRQVVKAQQIEP